MHERGLNAKALLNELADFLLQTEASVTKNDSVLPYVEELKRRLLKHLDHSDTAV